MKDSIVGLVSKATLLLFYQCRAKCCTHQG